MNLRWLNTPFVRDYSKVLPKLLECNHIFCPTQKLHFGDDDAIHDVKIQVAVWKCRHKYRHENPYAELLLV